ncbi:uncharacterized protein AB675_9532 [Cyphellophora attinorum]|uniref:Uncharacterized protein n=1 Tax=Cyphellophora attinorum TaxID=1664694 RepID=A0A0N0NP87_9EURO|nr:uncharacterized protein AB675_9532 [Phialophora attinorum]KPI42438.1 hypothetical protein AB675_9532 [Phialophora attinorum]
MQPASPIESTSNQWHNRTLAQPAQDNLSNALKKAWHTTVSCFDGIFSCCTGEREATQDRETQVIDEGIHVGSSPAAVATPSNKRSTEERDEANAVTTNPARIFSQHQSERGSELTLGITPAGPPLEVDSSQTVIEDLTGARAVPEADLNDKTYPEAKRQLQALHRLHRPPRCRVAQQAHRAPGILSSTKILA